MELNETKEGASLYKYRNVEHLKKNIIFQLCTLGK